MKALVVLAAVVAILVAVWWIVGRGDTLGQNSESGVDRGATVAIDSERREGADPSAAAAVVPPSAPRPSITPKELRLKIDMLRRDLKQAKNDGHRMFILKQVTANCTRAGSFTQCREVLEGVSDLIVDPALSRELGELIETMKKRAGAMEEKSGSRDRALPRPATSLILSA
jgi:hypothetical protein